MSEHKKEVGELWEKAEPLKGFEEWALAEARRLFERDGQLGAALVMELPVGDPVTVPVAVTEGDDGANEASMERARRAAAALHSRAVAFMAETWTVEASVPGGDAAAIDDVFSVEPRLSPLRRENIMVIVEQYAVSWGKPRMWNAAIVRGGGPPTLSAFLLCKFSDLGGRASGFLPKINRAARRGATS
jgi:hypothetical protein